MTCSYGLEVVASLAPLLAAVSLLDELITTSRVLDLNNCRALCGIPASITRKKDLVEALLLKTRCPRKREAVIRHLTDKMTGHALRSWISSLRRAGSKVPDAKVMNRGRAEILDAIIHLECPPAGEYSSADSDGESSAQEGETHEKGHREEPVMRDSRTPHRSTSADEAAAFC